MDVGVEEDLLVLMAGNSPGHLLKDLDAVRHGRRGDAKRTPESIRRRMIRNKGAAFSEDGSTTQNLGGPKPLTIDQDQPRLSRAGAKPRPKLANCQVTDHGVKVWIGVRHC